MASRIFYHASFVFLISIFGGIAAFAQEHREKYQFLISGMKSEREKLTSGVVRGKGERTVTRKRDEKTQTVTGPLDYSVAFDFVNEKIRADRKEPDLVGTVTNKPAFFGQYVETSKRIEYCFYELEQPASTAIVYLADPKNGIFEFADYW